MTDRILIPFDGSPQSKDAVRYAIRTFPDAELVALTVIDPAEAGYAINEGGLSEENWYESAREEAEHTQEILEELDDGRGIETDHVLGRPEKAIVEYVEEADIDQIVMGSHGRTGMTRLLLGSVAEGVMRRSQVPVTIIR